MWTRRRERAQRRDTTWPAHERLENATTNVELLSNQATRRSVRDVVSRQPAWAARNRAHRSFSGRERPSTQALATCWVRCFARLSDVESRAHRELSARTQLRGGGSRAPRSSAGRPRIASRACGSRPPRRSGGRGDRCRAPPSASTRHARVRRSRSSASTPSSAATRRALDDFPGHAGAARPAAGPGEPAPGDARSPERARGLRSCADCRAAGLRGCRSQSRRGRAVADIGAGGNLQAMSDVCSAELQLGV